MHARTGAHASIRVLTLKDTHAIALHAEAHRGPLLPSCSESRLSGRVEDCRDDCSPSRWRDTQTLQLHYDLTRLPFRGQLYDEVKPLSETLCLGLGGLNRQPEKEGDLFFFLLEAR